MIVVRFNGGLGNQLFQYAMGRHLSLIHSRPLKFDISGYTSSEPDPRAGIRVFGLDAFTVDGQVATPGELKEFEIYRAAGTQARFARLTNSLMPLRCRPYVLEHKNDFWQFKPSILKSPLANRVSVVGYWQTAKYFESIAGIIRNDVKLRHPPASETTRLLSEMAHVESVSVHVRHGDNATAAAKDHGVLPLSYYRKAASLIGSETRAPHFFVFSDDAAWAKATLELPGATTFVTHNGDAKNYEDLWLMAACRHHIVGNSTFSWWGAWLGMKDSQRVFAPEKYFVNRKVRFLDYYPRNWNLLPIS